MITGTVDFAPSIWVAGHGLQQPADVTHEAAPIELDALHAPKHGPERRARAIHILNQIEERVVQDHDLRTSANIEDWRGVRCPAPTRDEWRSESPCDGSHAGSVA